MVTQADHLSRRIAIIPARGGSKGLPGKNIKDFNGRPLIAWSVQAAIESGLFDTVVTSTDSADIQRVAVAAGAEAPFLRPNELATDTATSADVVQDVLNRYPGHEWLCLLQPTSPLRTSRDLIESWKLAEKPGIDAVISMSVQSHPIEWSLSVTPDARLQPIDKRNFRKRRQDIAPTYLPNGAIYWIKVSSFIKLKDFWTPDTAGYQMPNERSVDIDSLYDFRLAEWAANHHFDT